MMQWIWSCPCIVTGDVIYRVCDGKPAFSIGQSSTAFGHFGSLWSIWSWIRYSQMAISQNPTLGTLTDWWFGTVFIFVHIFGMLSSQLTKSVIFQRGRYTTNQLKSLLHGCLIPAKDVLLDSVLTHPQITSGPRPHRGWVLWIRSCLYTCKSCLDRKTGFPKLIQKTPQKTYGFFLGDLHYYLTISGVNLRGFHLQEWESALCFFSIS